MSHRVNGRIANDGYVFQKRVGQQPTFIYTIVIDGGEPVQKETLNAVALYIDVAAQNVGNHFSIKGYYEYKGVKVTREKL